jgi:hypothetical protein
MVTQATTPALENIKQQNIIRPCIITDPMPSTFPEIIFRLFRWRGFKLALLAFQLLWLNVIVPGHRRGIVNLPGSGCPECQAAAEMPNGDRCPVHENGKSHSPAPADPAAHCAICFFSARLSPAVAFDFTHPPLELIGAIERAKPIVHYSPEFASTYLGRAPPAIV